MAILETSLEDFRKHLGRVKFGLAILLIVLSAIIGYSVGYDKGDGQGYLRANGVETWADCRPDVTVEKIVAAIDNGENVAGWCKFTARPGRELHPQFRKDTTSPY